MNAGELGPEPRDDVAAVARSLKTNTPEQIREYLREALDVVDELYAALVEARPYVYNRAAPEGRTSDDWRAATAADVLERVDGAIADAGELLSGVTS